MNLFTKICENSMNGLKKIDEKRVKLRFPQKQAPFKNVNFQKIVAPFFFKLSI